MQSRRNMLTSMVKIGLCAVLALGFVAQIQAQNSKVDGTWTWTRPGRNGGEDVKITLKLKTEGDKLTGKLSQPGRNGQANEIEIKEGKVKGDEISFNVVREGRNGGNSFTTKYTGKVKGDEIKGKTEFERNGQTQSRDWEAKRDTK